MNSSVSLAIAFGTAFAVGCDRREPAHQVTTPAPVDAAREEIAEPGNELVALTVVSTPGSRTRSDADASQAKTPLTIASRGSSSRTAIDAQLEHLLPGDDWSSERESQRIAELIRSLIAAEQTAAALADFVPPDFRTEALRPRPLDPIYERNGLVVRRFRRDGEAASAPLGGVSGLARALASLRAAFPRETSRFDIHVTEFRFLSGGRQSFEAKVDIDLAHESREGVSREATTTWRCTWSARDDDPPRLREIRVESYEETSLERSGSAEGSFFVDATTAAVGALPEFAAQQRRGIESWAERITRLGDLHLTGHHGIAVGDVDGDGRDDLYVCDGGSLPNRLYRQLPNGAAEDISARAGVDFLEDSRSALLVDLDGDADQDLVLATIAMIVFAENDGSGRFTVRGGHPGAPYPYSLSAADFDLDGDLDVFVCVYGAADEGSGARGFEASAPVPFHDARNGGRNVLLENRAAFAFVDATDAVGLGRENSRWSLAAAWEDVDSDGDLDLYIANDFGPNQLFRNDAAEGARKTRRFTEIAAAAGVEDFGAGMSVAWGDANADGRADLYVGNMFSSAGLRVGAQANFVRNRDAETTAQTQRMARGNSLFVRRNNGLAFEDTSLAAGVTHGGWAWSSGFADINNDGWEDLVVANGFLSSTRPGDL